MAQAASASSTRAYTSGLGLFVRDFDDPVAGGVIVLDEPDAAESEPAPAITQEVLDEARAAAHALGLAAGRAAAEAEREAERGALLAALLDQLRDAGDQIRRAVDEAGTGLARLVLASLAAGFPSLCARHGAAELGRFTREVTALLAHEPRIVIRVHPAMLPALDECLGTLEPEQRETIVVEPRSSLAPGDARIAWRHGLAVRDAAALQARLGDILAPLGLAPEPVSVPGPGPGSAPALAPLPASISVRQLGASFAPTPAASPSQPTRFDVAAAS